MFFQVCLYAALIVFGLGTIYKIITWFSKPTGDPAVRLSTGKRMGEGIKGIFSTLFSAKFFRLLKVWFLEVFVQKQIGREGFIRWFMHFCIAYGFIFLLLMHALDRFITQKLFPEYFSTINPFLFLRNLFGAMMLLGLIIAAYRRIFNRVMRLTTRWMDVYALVVLALIALSGFSLEAVKIVSHERYEEMVAEYGSISDEEEAAALRAYWAKEFAVVFPRTPSSEAGMLAKGKEVHEMNCASCHSRPTAAFVSYGLAKAVTPAALTLGRKGVREGLLYLHYLVCFLGLALLPFTKFFHVLTSPLVLLINRVTDRSRTSPANKATIRAIELDACTHCATCSIHCSVGPVYREIPNLNIFPSEKLKALAALIRKEADALTDLAVIREGEAICTLCFRCTSVCPVGINLQDQWFAMEEDLSRKGSPEPFIKLRRDFVSRFDADRSKVLTPLTAAGKKFKEGVGLSFQGSSFNNCFTCQTCSNACPLVASYQFPREKLGLLPHQIMYSLKFGVQNNVLGAAMVWDCLGCYNCQENCPQGVRVTDIFFELKSMAFHQARAEK